MREYFVSVTEYLINESREGARRMGRKRSRGSSSGPHDQKGKVTWGRREADGKCKLLRLLFFLKITMTLTFVSILITVIFVRIN